MRTNGFEETIDWYNQNAEQYAKVGEDYYDLANIAAFSNLLFAGATVLDVGCGPGRDSNLLTQQQLNVTGIDLSHGFIEVAKRKYPSIAFLEGDMLSLPFPDKQFDGVWSNTSILHFETLKEVKLAIAEMFRALKVNGVLHLLVKARTGDEKTAIVTDKLSNHDRFFQYFTTDELTALIENAGFTMISIEQYPETDRVPYGRPEVELIHALARKL